MTELTPDIREEIRAFLSEEQKRYRIESEELDSKHESLIRDFLDERSAVEEKRRDRFSNRVVAIFTVVIGFLFAGFSAAFYFFTASIESKVISIAGNRLSEVLTQQQIIEAKAQIRLAQLQAVRFTSDADMIMEQLEEKQDAWTKLEGEIDQLSRLLGTAQNLQSIKNELAADDNFLGRLTGNAQGTPSGIVIASTEICSKLAGGWSEYVKADGRMIIGAGVSFSLQQVGGEEQVALTEEQMPKHNHGGALVIANSALAGMNNDFAYHNTGAPVALPTSGGRKQDPLGSSAPHNNMPPYIALYFCKKD